MVASSDCFGGLPESLGVDELGLIEAVDGFGESIIVGIANTPHRGLKSSFCQPFGIANRQILATPVTVMDDAIGLAKDVVSASPDHVMAIKAMIA